jgi:hypothetical protein
MNRATILTLDADNQLHALHFALLGWRAVARVLMPALTDQAANIDFILAIIIVSVQILNFEI